MTAGSAPYVHPLPEIDDRRFRDALSHFVTGVVLVTAGARPDERVGVTVNSFTSVSLDPPLVLFCLGRRAKSLPVILSNRAFAANILGREQRWIADRFSLGTRSWTGVETATWVTGAPILVDAPAALDCVLQATHDGGDHVIVVGRVVRLDADDDRPPLGYYRGNYVGIDRRKLPLRG
ncbi:MAG: flavin reductase family protein [Rhodospirillaceae bacterium]|nr:flavin reductase family protein [Rhodospirillaceae bacterium]